MRSWTKGPTQLEMNEERSPSRAAHLTRKATKSAIDQCAAHLLMS